MSADQPAEATQPRLWLATVDYGDRVEHDIPLWGPDGSGDYQGWSNLFAYAGDVSDLRPAVVVPERDDEGEVERAVHDLRRRLTDLTWTDETADGLALAVDTLDDMCPAVLAAQRPVAPGATADIREAVAEALARHDNSAASPPATWSWRTYADAAIRAMQAAPVAVDEATVTRVRAVIGGHRPSGRSGCACGEDYWTADHVTAEVVRALAARDEDPRPHPTRDDDYGSAAGQL